MQDENNACRSEQIDDNAGMLVVNVHRWVFVFGGGKKKKNLINT